MPENHFPVLILTGRPASGKSEIIHYLQSLSPDMRLERYHMGELVVLDDFPMLWTWFEEDQILSQKLGQPRLFTDEELNFKDHVLWDLLVERLGLEYHKLLRDQSNFMTRGTVIVEFSRGVEHGGYQRALEHLPADLLEKAVFLYVQVSFAESLRKNRLRFNPNRPDSILEHSLPDEKLARLYGEDDWLELIANQPELMYQDGIAIPYAVFPNEDDVTTGSTDKMADRLEKVMNELWTRYSGKGNFSR